MYVLEPEYVAARGALLDALAALEGHRDQLVLVGAQAVYHHTGEADLNIPLMTTDADLAINASALADAPEIGGALRAAGFRAGVNPGHWIGAGEVAVDLMVVPHQANTAKSTARAARLAPHDPATARIARGLEPALVDHGVVQIAALDADDDRSFDVRVAGPSALLVAKTIKIAERLVQADTQPTRLKQKDALDVFRLLQAVETDVFADGLTKHRSDTFAGAVSREALDELRAHGSEEGHVMPRLATDAMSGDPTVAPSFAYLVRQVLEAVH
ncbi:GSU2403 family nucleotidyltransferase fold protein [Cellulosimicrobium aquatile]|uniref:GSU2403 family nucleotidyltransferase fold protein n=1 Tax=Cellulosimicrobium aquatile TaxID=1612203 RepID=UPI0014596EA8|nr:GSU2403 family nucleotidyltransferase fold protein [Cellulosimicrobium aquatile]NMF29707.1 hypothetical protein [Cellulosimicrobium aquatile]